MSFVWKTKQPKKTEWISGTMKEIATSLLMLLKGMQLNKERGSQVMKIGLNILSFYLEVRLIDSASLLRFFE